MTEHVFVGFGFGPIQAGLFAKEAFDSGNFRRIVVAEIDQRLVDAVRSNRGSYYINIARSDRIERVRIDGIELLNPTHPQEVAALRTVLAEATEITICLPSVNFYDSGGAGSVATLIADGLRERRAGATIVYAAENNNHAAEILQEAVTRSLNAPLPPRIRFLNTVIGKMSQVVADPHEIAARDLAPIAPGIDRAFLVEEFNRILVTQATVPDFAPGIEVFIEKEDLLPFEEAKLYGHNAVHALLGFIGTLKGYVKMTEIKGDEPLMRVAREAFIKESGGALIRKYASLGDGLFTEPGYRRYAEDLLERMTNPYLGDTVARAARDIIRKLGVNDRIFGTMSLALDHDIEPVNMAMGALAGIVLLPANAAEYGLPVGRASHTASSSLHMPIERRAVRTLQELHTESLTHLLTALWHVPLSPALRRIIACTCSARKPLIDLLAQ